MNLANRFNLLLHWCVALSVLAFATADDRPLLALLGVVGTGVAWVASRGKRVDRPLTLPRWSINVLVLAAIVNAAMHASQAHGPDVAIVSTLGQFLVFVTLLKLLDRRGPRDDAQLITLSVFIAIAAVLTSNEFLMGIMLIAYVPTAVATAMTWQLRAGDIMLAKAVAERAGGAPGQARPTPARAATGRRPRRGFMGVLFGSVGAASAIATAVFVLVPRGIGSDFLGRFGMTRQPIIGYRESVRLGESGFLNENPTPVMDVGVTTVDDEPVGSAQDLLYLRGAARDRYNTQTHMWEDSHAHDGRRPESTDVPEGRRWTPWGRIDAGTSGHGAMAISAIRKLKVSQRAETPGGTIFTLWRPVALTPDRSISIAFSKADGAMRRSSPPAGQMRYTVECRTVDELGRAPSMVVDEPLPGVRDVTARLLAARGLGADAAQTRSRQVITAIRDYLRANYEYTTEMVAPPERQDPIEFFLLTRKKGHCEYFASAMAAMCQSQGIPARVVTGYLATEYNSLSGQYVVRESNAHAWVEAFVTVDPEADLGRWETFDPSPPGDIERLHRPPGGVMAQLRSWYDAIEFGWSSRVVGFDNAREERERARLAGDDRAFNTRMTMWADKLAAWARTIKSDPGSAPWWIKSSPALVAAGVGLALVVRRVAARYDIARGKAQARQAAGVTLVKPTGFYARALKALARAGVPKPDAVPPAKFADDLEARSPVAASCLRAIAALHYQARFGGRPLTPAQTSAGERQARDLAAALEARA